MGTHHVRNARRRVPTWYNISHYFNDRFIPSFTGSRGVQVVSRNGFRRIVVERLNFFIGLGLWGAQFNGFGQVFSTRSLFINRFSYGLVRNHHLSTTRQAKRWGRASFLAHQGRSIPLISVGTFFYFLRFLLVGRARCRQFSVWGVARYQWSAVGQPAVVFGLPESRLEPSLFDGQRINSMFWGSSPLAHPFGVGFIVDFGPTNGTGLSRVAIFL